MSTLEQDQKQVIETEITPYIEQARTLVVKSSEQRAAAVYFGKGLKEFKAKIEERFHPTANREKALKLWQESKDTENAFYVPIDAAIEVVKKTIQAYDREEALKQQRIIDEAMAKQREAERKEREKLEAQAKKAEEKGKVEKAEVLREQAENVQVAPVFIPIKDVKKLVWKARIINPLAACQSIVQGLIPCNAAEFKQAALNDLAKVYDANKAQVPGVEFYQDVSGRI